jgi:hypothetical protein
MYTSSIYIKFTNLRYLKAFIKNDYNTSYTKDIYIAEIGEDKEVKPIKQSTSKSF